MEGQVEKDQIYHDFSGQSSSALPMKAIIIFIFIILLGVSAGYFLSQTKSQKIITTGSPSASQVTKGSVFGATDLSSFKDTATGVLQAGGIQNEGQYHLVRPGGDSQNVYLTSSVVDLNQFVGHKITVHGATQTAKVAGWLMDVGQVEVVQ